MKTISEILVREVVDYACDDLGATVLEHRGAHAIIFMLESDVDDLEVFIDNKQQEHPGYHIILSLGSMQYKYDGLWAAYEITATAHDN